MCPHCVPATCHPTWSQELGIIRFIQGFSNDASVLTGVESALKERSCKRVVVMHDSDHRKQTVRSDLSLYNRFVTVGSYLIVQDTKLSRMLGGRYNTMEAVTEFLQEEGKGKFEIDKRFEFLLFSHHHNGFLQRVAE